MLHRIVGAHLLDERRHLLLLFGLGIRHSFVLIRELGSEEIVGFRKALILLLHLCHELSELSGIHTFGFVFRLRRIVKINSGNFFVWKIVGFRR
jgi:hypothetical protein